MDLVRVAGAACCRFPR
ncbi:hypothetical protein [Rhodococcus sp. SJ-3]